MDSRSTGRVIGLMVLLQFAVGFSVNMVLTAPLFGDPGYLYTAAENGLQVGIAALIAVVGMVISVAVAALAYPVLNARSMRMAIAYVVLVAIGAALSGVEHGGLLAMRAFSEAYASGGDDQALFESLFVVGALMRNGMHHLGLLVSGVTLGLWYLCMYRFALLPKAIAVLGLLAVALQLFTISQPVMGGDVNFTLLLPLALAQLIQGGWLLVKGFPQSP
ncbi:MAG: DUF4386 family protein [Pseudomonadota bacterium]